MKSLLVILTASLFFASCSHLHEISATDKSKVLEVNLADKRHKPKIGDPVVAFNWICQIVGKGSRSARWSCNRENEINGKINEVSSNEKIKVLLENDFTITKETYVDLK